MSIVALVVLIDPVDCVVTVVPPLLKTTLAVQFHSPAVRLTLVTLAGVLLVSDTGVLLLVAQPVGDPPFVTWAQMNSPTEPALALLLVVVPTIPAVCDGVIAPVTVNVVNAPAAGAVLPIAGGDANRLAIPEPPTVPLAVRLVKNPGAAATLPIVGGDANKLVMPVPLTVPLAAKVVNDPVLGVVAPTDALLIVPPEIVPPLIDGLVSVLFVNVSVVARPTKVSVEVGSVSVPVLTMLEISGVVSVGEVPNTREPVPVSSEMIPKSCADVVVAN